MAPWNEIGFRVGHIQERSLGAPAPVLFHSRIARHDAAANDVLKIWDLNRRCAPQRPDDYLRRVDGIVVWLESGEEHHGHTDFPLVPGGVFEATELSARGLRDRVPTA
jgi:hypothetical protein